MAYFFLIFSKLESSLDYNDSNAKIENEIHDKQKKIFKLMEEYKSWQEPFLNRGKYFFGFVEKLMNYIILKSKFTSDINWLNLPGFIHILNAITHEIHIKQTNTPNKSNFNIDFIFSISLTKIT